MRVAGATRGVRQGDLLSPLVFGVFEKKDIKSHFFSQEMANIKNYKMFLHRTFCLYNYKIKCILRLNFTDRHVLLLTFGQVIVV